MEFSSRSNSIQSGWIDQMAYLAVGVFAGFLIAAGGQMHPYLGIIAGLVLALSIPIVLKPEWGFLIFIFLILVLEEFPSGLGDSVERSSRMFFYSKSIGISGFYATDLLLLALIGLYLFHVFVMKKKWPIIIDKVGIFLFVMAAAGLLTALLPLLIGNPLEIPINVTHLTGTAVEVNERGARLIAFFQYKVYGYLFLSYLLGVMAINSRKVFMRVCYVFLAAAGVCMLIGIARLSIHPGLVKDGIPLFYDSPSSWFFGLFIMGTLVIWSMGLLDKWRLKWMWIVSAFFVLFILISFRRTMWAAIALSGVSILFLLPRQAIFRIVKLVIMVGSLLLVVLMVSPFGTLVVHAIMARISETSVADASTLYRLTLLNHMIRHFDEFPLFGYGVTPLWNQSATFGFFRINLENIHSLYFWILLRSGWFGLLVWLGSMAGITITIISFIRSSRNHLFRIIAILVLSALFMLLFSGIFNPVYGEARYMIIIGLGLALITRMKYLEKI